MAHGKRVLAVLGEPSTVTPLNSSTEVKMAHGNKISIISSQNKPSENKFNPHK
jgi:hypothetical protein